MNSDIEEAVGNRIRSITSLASEIRNLIAEYKAKNDLLIAQLAEKTREVAVLENTIALLESDINQLKQEAITSPPPAGTKYP